MGPCSQNQSPAVNNFRGIFRGSSAENSFHFVISWGLASGGSPRNIEAYTESIHEALMEHTGSTHGSMQAYMEDTQGIHGHARSIHGAHMGIHG